MGKTADIGRSEQTSRQKNAVSDSNVCDCCIPVDAFVIKNTRGDYGGTTKQTKASCEQKELVVIGAGPHSLALMLRLLEPNADLSSEKERHIMADFPNRIRPPSKVRKHIENLMHGPSAIYRKTGPKNTENDLCPPLSLDFVKKNVLVVDASLSDSGRTNSLYGWMSGWMNIFQILKIDQLRSPISAHADPFDHRSLEFFAKHTNREGELVPLNYLSKTNKKWDFHGPYNSPSADLFHDFHRQLISGYGVQDLVTPGIVKNIRYDDSGQFQVSITNPSNGHSKIVQTPRVVCALGPAYRKEESIFQSRIALEPWQVPHRILHGDEIMRFLAKHSRSKERLPLNNQDILIVGGGVTSAHLALTACDGLECPWCESVLLIQRSKMKERQFDLDSAWMGPGRGNRLDQFWTLPFIERVRRLGNERGGGSIHPEVIQLLKERASLDGPVAKLSLQEETEIMEVHYDYQNDKLLVSMDDGLPHKAFDMIWLATGFENHIDNYQCLDELRKQLLIGVVGGLPVLGGDLSWKEWKGGRVAEGGKSSPHEPTDKENARKRFWVMGSLAGMELGPDALNLMGARHGAVRVAKALLSDFSSKL